MAPTGKPLIWLSGEVKSPPFTPAARRDVGALLRNLQLGRSIGMLHSRPMPAIGSRCHELRVNAGDKAWRVFYRIDPDAILVVGVHEKRTEQTTKSAIDACRGRLRIYDAATKPGDL